MMKSRTRIFIVALLGTLNPNVHAANPDVHDTTIVGTDKQTDHAQLFDQFHRYERAGEWQNAIAELEKILQRLTAFNQSSDLASSARSKIKEFKRTLSIAQTISGRFIAGIESKPEQDLVEGTAGVIGNMIGNLVARGRDFMAYAQEAQNFFDKADNVPERNRVKVKNMADRYKTALLNTEVAALKKYTDSLTTAANAAKTSDQKPGLFGTGITINEQAAQLRTALGVPAPAISENPTASLSEPIAQVVMSSVQLAENAPADLRASWAAVSAALQNAGVALGQRADRFKADLQELGALQAEAREFTQKAKGTAQEKAVAQYIARLAGLEKAFKEQRKKTYRTALFNIHNSSVWETKVPNTGVFFNDTLEQVRTALSAAIQ